VLREKILVPKAILRKGRVGPGNMMKPKGHSMSLLCGNFMLTWIEKSPHWFLDKFANHLLIAVSNSAYHLQVCFAAQLVISCPSSDCKAVPPWEQILTP